MVHEEDKDKDEDHTEEHKESIKKMNEDEAKFIKFRLFTILKKIK